MNNLIQCSECGEFIHKEAGGYCCQYCGHSNHDVDYRLVRNELDNCNYDEIARFEQQYGSLIDELTRDING